MSRVEMLRKFIVEKPGDPFPRYALALELKNGGSLAEAWAMFEALMIDRPDYVVAYLHAGNTLVALGRHADAAATFRRGIDACARAGDSHARGELEGALSLLPASPPSSST